MSVRRGDQTTEKARNFINRVAAAPGTELEP
jgi:hypothetical protein